ncbi:MAG: hypothetical protein H6577_20270 [Lewinellaceae bacterium]|nr:hypothetical protein [Saprospiraceae bacterium]MCB9340466.1 hypothetical protein [Lewinellaceae bacterium]
MVKTEKMMSPQEVLKGLEKVMADIKSEELTPEGRAALLEQVKKMEMLLLEMKEEFSKRSQQNGATS